MTQVTWRPAQVLWPRGMNSLTIRDVTGQSKFKSAGKSGAGNGGNNRFRHRLADRHGLIEKSAMVACVVRPLAARSANLLGNLNERGNIEMAIKISGRSAGYDDDANARIPGKSL